MANRKITPKINFLKGWGTTDEHHKKLENVIVDENGKIIPRDAMVDYVYNSTNKIVQGGIVLRQYADVKNEGIMINMKNNTGTKEMNTMTIPINSNQSPDISFSSVNSMYFSSTNTEKKTTNQIDYFHKNEIVDTSINKLRLKRIYNQNYADNYDVSDSSTRRPFKVINGITRNLRLGTFNNNITDYTAPSAFTFEGVASNGSVIIAVGSGGKIYRSTDNAANWTSITSPTTNTLRGVLCLQGSATMYIVGDSVILKSTNSGLTWASISASVPAKTFFSGKMITASQVVFVSTCSSSNFITYTPNGGTSLLDWGPTRFTGTCGCMIYNDKGFYFFVVDGTTAYVYYSAILGASLSIKTIGAAIGAWNFSFDNYGNIVAFCARTPVVQDIYVSNTDNAMSNWNLVKTIKDSVVSDVGINSLQCINNTFVLPFHRNDESGRGTYMYVSQDGGKSWILKRRPFNDDAGSGYLDYFFCRGTCVHDTGDKTTSRIVYVGYKTNTGIGRIYSEKTYEFTRTDEFAGVNLGVWKNSLLNRVSVSAGPAGTTYNYLVALVVKRTYQYNGKTYIDRSEPRYLTLATANAINDSNPMCINNIPKLISANASDFYEYSDIYCMEVYRTANNGSTYYNIGDFNQPVYNDVTYTQYSYSDDTQITLLGMGTLYTNSNILPYIPAPKCKWVVNSNGVNYYARCYGSLTDATDVTTNYDNRVYLSHKGLDSTSYTFFIEMPATIEDICVVYDKVYVSCDLKWYRLDGYFESNGTGGCTYTLVSGTLGAIAPYDSSYSIGVDGFRGRYYQSTDGIYLFSGSTPVKVSTFNEIYDDLVFKDSCYYKEKRLVIFVVLCTARNKFLANLPCMLVFNEISNTWTVWHEYPEFSNYVDGYFFNTTANPLVTPDFLPCNGTYLENVNEIDGDNDFSVFFGYNRSFASAKKLLPINGVSVQGDTVPVTVDKDVVGLSAPFNYFFTAPKFNILSYNLNDANNKIMPVKQYTEISFEKSTKDVAYTIFSVQPYAVKNSDNIKRKMATYNFVRDRIINKEEVGGTYSFNSDFFDANIERMLPDSVSRSKEISLGITNGWILKRTNIPNQTLAADANSSNKYAAFTITIVSQYVFTVSNNSQISLYDHVCLYNLVNGQYIPVTMLGKRMTPVNIMDITGNDITVNPLANLNFNAIPDKTNLFAVFAKRADLNSLEVKNIQLGYVDYNMNFDAGKEEK